MLFDENHSFVRRYWCSEETRLSFEMFVKIILFTLLPFLIKAASIEAAPKSDKNETKYIMELIPATFDQAIQEKPHFIMFHSTPCDDCENVKLVWEDLAEMRNVDDDPKVIMAKVDCTEHQELCIQNEITGYPTLKLFKLGEKEAIKFKGTRDMVAITEFINKNLESNENDESADSTGEDEDKGTGEAEPPSTSSLIELTEENFANHISIGNHFVDFYAPWCIWSHRAEPIWESLAKELKDEKSVRIAKIDCTQNRPICQDFEVKGYPSLLWIEDGKKIEKYSGDKNLDDLKEYVEKMLGADKKSAHSTEDEQPTKQANIEENHL